ncbi:MAG: flagellar hook-basal body protein [Kurthia sp.]|nr:flagellar hook-basal body protein [Candidatus Kurthia equi]
MLRTMISAANTMSQLQSKLDTVSNNIANSNTTGFKARSATFGELMYQQMNNDKQDTAPRQSAKGIRIGVGAQIAQTKLNTAIGSMSETKRNLDFALTKENQYFAVTSPQTGEQLLSRQGNFYLTPRNDGGTDLVNSDGYHVVDANGDAISFKENVSGITTSPDGQLQVSYTDGTTEAKELAVVQVDKPNLLEQDQDKYLRYSADIAREFPNAADVLHNITGAERGEIEVQSGMLEGSNVDLSKEMSELISTQRSYQFNARTITMADQMLGLINSVR